MENPEPRMIALSLQGGYAFCADEGDGASLLRMGFGAKREGGVRLHILEAAYLAGRGKATLTDGKKEIPIKKLLAQKSKSKSSPPLSDQYEIFKAFRQAGHVVRFSSSSPLHWRVYARGVGREQDRPSTLVMVVGKDWNATLSTLEKALSTARALRLEMCLAFVSNGKIHLVKLGKMPLEV